jgi:hypothetical protein
MERREVLDRNNERRPGSCQRATGTWTVINVRANAIRLPPAGKRIPPQILPRRDELFSEGTPPEERPPANGEQPNTVKFREGASQRVGVARNSRARLTLVFQVVGDEQRISRN